MIVAFATQKGGTGKTTLAIAFTNYLSKYYKKDVKVYDLDFQKSFFQKWTEDEMLDIPKLYDVEVVEDVEKKFSNYEQILEMKDSDTIYIFDLAGTLDASYSDLLMYADFIIIPFEYSNVSVKSTLVFINYLGYVESEAERVFIRSKLDKGYKYLNKEGMDKEISRLGGKLLETPVYKRNCLQTINTRDLTYEQKYAVNTAFEELIKYIEQINGKTL